MKEEIVKRWIAKAESDIKLIEHMVSHYWEIIPDILCFHAQQAVEKYLKAYLTLNDVRVRKTHDIALLIEECTKIDKDFAKIKSTGADKLTIYAVEIRYPDDFYTPTLEEAEEAYEIALSVRNFVRRKLGVD